MKRRDTEGQVLIEECRWRIQGAIDGGASAQEVADAAGLSNVTIYSYLGRGEKVAKSRRSGFSQYSAPGSSW